MKDALLIETSSNLLAYVQTVLSDHPDFIALDTEFVRQETYRPHLCWVQIYDGKTVALIDALSVDLGLLKPLLFSSVMKIVHSGREDIEACHALWRDIPSPLFDTQIAEHILGRERSLSYKDLVFRYKGLSLDKTYQFVDWTRRPLPPSWKDYMIQDVLHLPFIYETQRNSLNHDWGDAMNVLQDPKTYTPNIKRILQRLCPPQTSEDSKEKIEAWIRWREGKAERQNIPRGHVMRDSEILKNVSEGITPEQ